MKHKFQVGEIVRTKVDIVGMACAFNKGDKAKIFAVSTQSGKNHYRINSIDSLDEFGWALAYEDELQKI